MSSIGTTIKIPPLLRPSNATMYARRMQSLHHLTKKTYRPRTTTIATPLLLSSCHYASGFSSSPQPPSTFSNDAFELMQDFLRKNDNLHLQLEEARKKESEHEKTPIRTVSKYEEVLVKEAPRYEKALVTEAYKYEKLQIELVEAYDELRKTESKFSIRAALERITYAAIAAQKLGGLGTKGPMSSKIISTPNDTISSRLRLIAELPEFMATARKIGPKYGVGSHHIQKTAKQIYGRLSEHIHYPNRHVILHESNFNRMEFVSLITFFELQRTWPHPFSFTVVHEGRDRPKKGVVGRRAGKRRIKGKKGIGKNMGGRVMDNQKEKEEEMEGGSNSG